MSRSERRPWFERPARASGERGDWPVRGSVSRSGRWIGLLAIVILVLITINTVVTPSNGLAGLAPGAHMPPFAVPLATSNLQGGADIATHPDEGAAGRRPACTVRGPRILNICQLYEQGPVVLALFVDGSACTGVLGEMQALAPSFPGVRFAAVAISLRDERAPLRALVHSRDLTFPVGIDVNGVLPTLYKMATCPQVTFAYPGGVVQSRALLTNPSLAALRERVQALERAALGRGFRGS
jgi:hypothetical protein